MSISTYHDSLSAFDSAWCMEISRDLGEISTITPEDMSSFSRDIKTDGTAVLTWRGHQECGKDFTVTVTWIPCEDGRLEGHLAFSGYESSQTVETIIFPCFDLPVEDSVKLMLPSGALLQRKFLLNADHRFAVSAMQFCAVLQTTRDSFYIDWRDAAWNVKGYTANLTDDNILHLCSTYPLPVRPDAPPPSQGAIPYPCTVRFFHGGWFEAAQLYRPWGLQQRWWTSQPASNKLEDIGIWIWNRGLVNDVIPQTQRLQDALGPDVRVALDWYWWHSNPYDTDYPNFWPPREGEDTFKKAVKQLTDRGIHCQVYINGVCWDHDTASWEPGGREGALIRRDGSYLERDFNKYNHHRLCWMCGEAPAFQEQQAFLVRTLRQAGLTGQYMDMIGNATFDPCYSRSHHHPLGGGTYKVEGFRNLLKRVITENPGHPITIETASEPYMDLARGGIICNEVSSERLGSELEYVPVFTAVYHGKYAAFGSYALPDGIPPWDPLWPEKDRWPEEKSWHTLYPDEFFVEMARPVMWGAQPMVCNLRDRIFDDPEFADEYRFILETARFYSANRDFLYAGTMLSPDGFQCPEKDIDFFVRMIFTTQEKSHTFTRRLPVILHSIWQNANGQKALFLANITQTEQPWSYAGRSGTLPARSYRRINL